MKLLGSVAIKNMYMGFDMYEGRDIAWNQNNSRYFAKDGYAKKKLLKNKTAKKFIEQKHGSSLWFLEPH